MKSTAQSFDGTCSMTALQLSKLDTLAGLAIRYNVSVSKLQAATERAVRGTSSTDKMHIAGMFSCTVVPVLNRI